MNNGVSAAGNATNGVSPTTPSATKPVPYQKPVPPPTLPKTYTPSAASAYRLASLERLTAHRQRALEQQLNSSLSATNGVTESPRKLPAFGTRVVSPHAFAEKSSRFLRNYCFSYRLDAFPCKRRVRFSATAK
ncbi:hypothetical protein V9T40_005831 [Parthenolecanium corni]|uniref:Uncharacterized protein n=1 Tax=Parthenolecanium corni TaxID=536013 RepID=A0AAN9TXA8_9HEMI